MGAGQGVQEAGVGLDWWPPGRVWDKRKTHRLAPGTKNWGEGNTRGMGTQKPSCSFLVF